MARLDSRGRRIGQNHWRDYVTDQWRCADHAWFLQAEEFTGGYGVNLEELEEFRRLKPRPMLRDFMVELAPSYIRPSIPAAAAA